MKESLTWRKGTEKQQHPQNATVRIGPLSGLPDLVRDLGYDPDPIFNAAGFNTIHFTDPDIQISYVAGSNLLASCVAATGCDHLGLLLGQRASPSSLGVAGFILETSSDVGAALRSLVRHLDLHDRGAVASLVTTSRSTLFGYAIHLSGVKAADQIYDLSMAVVYNTLRSLCGENWAPTEVLLSRRPPKDPKPYQRFFRAPIRFNSDQSAVVFPNNWLTHTLPKADPLLHHHLEVEANALHANQQKSIVSELRRLLRISLTNHKSSVKGIAGQLGMHERTLNRRLQEEGTTFRNELQDIRYELARQLLADTTIPLSHIAMVIDYADPTAFCRAFKQWSGTSPREWRRLHSYKSH